MRFKIKDGKAAIYDQGPFGDLPLEDPHTYMDYVKWHNEFEHVGIVEIRDYSVSLPLSNEFSPPRTFTHVLDTHDQPAEPFVYGYVTLPGGARRPFSMHALISIATRSSSLAGISPHGFERNVSLGIDGANIVLHEWARGIYWSSDNHPAVTIGVRVFITDLSLSELESATPAAVDRTFRINAEETKLGPFDGDKRWLRIASDDAQFPLVNGRTVHGGSRINWGYAVPSDSDFAFAVSFGTAPNLSDTTSVDVTA